MAAVLLLLFVSRVLVLFLPRISSTTSEKEPSLGLGLREIALVCGRGDRESERGKKGVGANRGGVWSTAKLLVQRSGTGGGAASRGGGRGEEQRRGKRKKHRRGEREGQGRGKHDDAAVSQ